MASTQVLDPEGCHLGKVKNYWVQVHAPLRPHMFRHDASRVPHSANMPVLAHWLFEGSLIGSLALVSTCCPLDASLRRHAVGGPLPLERSLNFLPTQVSAKQATVAATPKALETFSRWFLGLIHAKAQIAAKQPTVLAWFVTSCSASSDAPGSTMSRNSMKWSHCERLAIDFVNRSAISFLPAKWRACQ